MAFCEFESLSHGVSSNDIVNILKKKNKQLDS